jgi:hypothetical protein
MSLEKKFILFCFLVPILLTAQRSNDHLLIMEDLYSGEAVETYDLRERKAVGDYFYNADWLLGQFVFDDGSLSKRNYLLKYDLLNHELLVNLDGGAFLVPTKNVSGFVIKEVNQNTNEIIDHTFFYKKVEDKPGRTIVEKIVEGSTYQLYILHKVEYLEANYVPALDAGSLSAKIIKKRRYCLQIGERILEIPARKKQATNFFENYPSASNYIKKHKMKIKSEEYLIGLVNFMNKLIK